MSTKIKEWKRNRSLNSCVFVTIPNFISIEMPSTLPTTMYIHVYDNQLLSVFPPFNYQGKCSEHETTTKRFFAALLIQFSKPL